MPTNVVLPRVVAAVVTAAGALAAGKHTPVNAAGGPLALTLPAAAPGNAGATLSVEKTDASANAVSISGSIRGATGSLALTLERQSLELVADSTGSWWPIAGYTPRSTLDAIYEPAGLSNASLAAIVALGATARGATTKSVATIVEVAGNDSFTYSSRIRPIQNRRSLRVINIGANPFQLGYSTAGDNTAANNPTWTHTIPAGSEFFDTSGNTAALFIRDTQATGLGIVALVVAETYL